MTDAVLIEEDGPVRILTMNRPQSLNAFDGEGQVPAGPRKRCLRVFAEARDDAAASFVDDVEAACELDQQRQRDQKSCPAERKLGLRRRAPFGRFFAAALAAEQLGEPAIDVAPDLVQIGRSAASAALTPLRIVERHDGASKFGRVDTK